MKISTTSTIVALAVICSLVAVTESAPAPSPTFRCPGLPHIPKHGLYGDIACPGGVEALSTVEVAEVKAQAPPAPAPTRHCGPPFPKRGYECPGEEVEALAPPAPSPTSHCKGGPVHDKRGYECPMDEVEAQAPAAPSPTAHCKGGPIHDKRGYECPM